MCIFFYPFLASVQQLQLERRRLLQVHDQPVPESALRQLEDGVGWPLLRPIQGRALRIQRRVLFRVQHRRRRRRRRRTPATAIARSQHVHDQGRSQAQLWRRFLNRETKKMKRNLEFEIVFFPRPRDWEERKMSRKKRPVDILNIFRSRNPFFSESRAYLQWQSHGVFLYACQRKVKRAKKFWLDSAEMLNTKVNLFISWRLQPSPKERKRKTNCKSAENGFQTGLVNTFIHSDTR